MQAGLWTVRGGALAWLVLALAACSSSSDGDSTGGDPDAGGDVTDAADGSTEADTDRDEDITDADDSGADDAETGSGADAGSGADVDAALDTDAVEEIAEPCPEADPDFLAPDPVLHTPRWAFAPWISKDISDRDDTFEFVQGFQARDIPVGVVVLDSPWETNYNTFVPNPSRYPEFEGMVRALSEDQVRVVLWITQMVNSVSFDAETTGDFYESPSPGFDLGQRCGFFVNEGATYAWWKGIGSGIDFSDDAAVTWWHQQQQRVLDAGIAGWKLDFGDEYVTTDTVVTDAGEVDHQVYSEAYYRDFLAWGQAQRGAEEFVTMVRPYDRSYGFEGRFFARPEHAPVAWVGDNRRDWIGFVDAMDHLFRSAQAGYIVIGSDVGGYLDRNDEALTETVPANENTFYSWVAMGALTPFMQLHGRANLTPWTYGENPDETVRIYRYWSWFHTQLIPFFYSLSEEAIAGRATMMAPVQSDEAAWANDWSFTIGGDLLMAPILTDDWTRDVTLPEGDEWYDWWNLGGDAIAGGTVIEGWTSTDRQRVPLYVRSGALIPWDVSNDLTGLGSAASAGRQTILWFPDETASSFVTHDLDGGTTTWAGSRDSTSATLTASRLAQSTILLIRFPTTPLVTFNGSNLTQYATLEELEGQEDGYTWDESLQRVVVRVPVSASETTLRLVDTR